MPRSTASSSSVVQRRRRRGQHREAVARRRSRPPGWASSDRPSAWVTTPPASCTISAGRRDVVREVRADRALADRAGTRARVSGQLVDEAAPDVDVRVELAGHDAGHVERGGAEVEVTAAASTSRRSAPRARRSSAATGRPRSPAVQNSAPRSVFVGTVQRDRAAVGPLGARAGPARREEAVAALDLVHDPERHVAERRVAPAAARPRSTRSTTRARPRPGGCRRPGRRRRSRAGSPNAT